MTTREYICYVLSRYNSIITDINTLRNEIQVVETLDETIETLAYPHFAPTGGIHGSKINDPTARVALIYRAENEKAARNHVDREQTEKTIKYLESVIRFIDTSLDALKKYKPVIFNVLCGLYIKQLPWLTLSRHMFISRSQLNRYRNSGIDILTAWWEGKPQDQTAEILKTEEKENG
ncbi:MAG: hypothetical protein WC248_04755 [Candidatus Methanomethylophilaceae archaeon]|jgi:hypothetical protein